MKTTWMIALWLFALLVCSALPVNAATVEPSVRLPTEYVTMRAEYGTTSWFDMTLSNVSTGFDVVDGSYLGWCSQRDTTMRRGVNHTVMLYSSYDPNMPELYRNNNWSKINYILNHKQGNRTILQQVIWYYTCNCSVSLDSQAQLLVNDTDEHGLGFVPSPGETIAIIVAGIAEIQRTFLELPLPSNASIGDLVWNDRDADGIQDAGEPGLVGITIGMYTANGTGVDSVVTDVHGYYSFAYFTAGEYYLKVTLPSGYHFSPEHRGSDPAKDSDVDPQTGMTSIATFDPYQSDMSWDAGMYVYVPGSPGTPAPQEETNHPPTADGTAGEPYKGFVGEEIRFNGSRSYDRDGTVVSWHWSFGDGTTADGVVVTHAYATIGSYTVALIVTDNDGANDTFTTTAIIQGPNLPPLQPQMIGPFGGHRNTSYSYSVVTTDPDGNNVFYLIDWGDGSQNTTSLFRSGYTIQLLHQWSTLGFYLVRVSAKDPSNATSDSYQVLVSIDVRYVGNLGYLMDTDGVEPFDMFYDNETGNLTAVQFQSNGDYLIDTNGDGSFDSVYNIQSGTVQAYSAASGPLQVFGSVYGMLLVGFIIAVIVIVLIAIILKRKK
jgi:PKD repeat protein